LAIVTNEPDVAQITAPVATARPTERTFHGDTVVDPYAWLADPDDPEVLAYLSAENEYTQARTAHLKDLQERLFGEIKARTKETDLSVPVRKGGYWYYGRTVEGQQYAIHARVAAGSGAEPPQVPESGASLAGEEIMLDDNLLAGDSEFFALGTLDVSPDGHLLAYSVDYSGDERFTLHVKDLRTGEVLPDELPEVHYGSAWSQDGSTLFYLTTDEAWRPYRVWRHRLGTDRAADVLVHEERDERFFVGIGLTRSEAYVVIDVHSKVTSEVRLIPATSPDASPGLVAARREGVEYEVEHDPAADRLLILHNDGAEDFELATAPLNDPAQWTPLIAHQPGTRLTSVDAFAGQLVVSLRRDGLTALRVQPRTGDAFDIDFPEPVYTVGLDSNEEYEAATIRLHYASLVTPDSVYDYDPGTRTMVLRKRRPVLGGVDLSRYAQHREWATAPDGTRVPISILSRVDTPLDGTAPALLYGYGAYETSMDPWFSIARLSLVERGVTFAVAHVRGGGELGRRWYDDGKLLAKRNTFSDFVACARHLAATGWTTPSLTVARGGSAGGLLVGAVANEAPDAFGAVVAEVPFVDALTTILDPSQPLTVTEWDEWGNPLADPEVYAYMKGYSPYENVGSHPYPSMLVLSSLHDTRVMFYEPTKWVARLRAAAPDADVLLRTEMGAGHSGPSGRYNAWREEAFILAWILDRVARA
jgi:oligopeptidase B